MMSYRGALSNSEYLDKAPRDAAVHQAKGATLFDKNGIQFYFEIINMYNKPSKFTVLTHLS